MRSILSAGTTKIVWLSALLVGFNAGLQAQAVINWLTLDAGGGAQASVNYLANFTAGQADIGRSTSANYTITAGFWAVENLGPAQAAPQLRIELVAGGVRLSWPSPSTGFVLQGSGNVTGGWSDVLNIPTDNGLTKSVTLSFTTTERFFRLRHP